MSIRDSGAPNDPPRPQMGLITYLVPYLPVTPTFLVLFVILAEFAVIDGGLGMVVEV